MEVDFTDQIKEMEADKKAGYPPNCNEGYEEKDGSCVLIEGYWKKKNMANYPGQSVERKKDGVPKKKAKKRACKPGEYRDKSGNLKKTKGNEESVTPSQPKTKDLQNPRNKHEYDSDRNVEVNEPVDMSDYMPDTKPLQNPRNMNEYYRNLYKKVKGLD